MASDEAAQFVLTREPGLHVESAAGVVVQRLPDGAASALATVDDGTYRVVFPGVATFAFRPEEFEMRVDAPLSTSRRVVEGLFHTTALPFALQTLGYEALHASAVQSSGGVVGLCARSGTGKTTLAWGLADRQGFRWWADDALVFAPRAAGEAQYRCLLLPHQPNLRANSREFFRIDDDVAAPAPATAGPDNLAALVLVERSGGAEPVLTRLSLVDALIGVLEHAYCFFVDEGRERDSVRTYTDLVAKVPVFRLRFPSGFDQFGAVLELLEAAFRDDA